MDALRSAPADSGQAEPRPMTKADICNVECVTLTELVGEPVDDRWTLAGHEQPDELPSCDDDDEPAPVSWLANDTIDKATKRFHLDVLEVDRVVRGYIRVNEHDYEPREFGLPEPKEKRLDQRYVSVSADDYLYENEIPPIGYEPDWAENVDDHGGNVAKAVVALLKWNVEKHQQMLDVVTQRLRDAELLKDEDEPETVIAGFAVS